MSALTSTGWMALITLIFVPPIYFLRRWRVGGWLAVLVALAVAYLIKHNPPADEFYLLGRLFVVDQLWGYIMVVLLVSTASLFVLSLNVSQGWTFYPLGLVIVALLGLAMASRHIGIAALLIEIAVLLTVFIIQGGRIGSVRGALRFLVMMTLAVPLFLLVAWQHDVYRDNLNNPAFAIRMGLLVAGGFALWLGVAPLHGWISAVAQEAKPGIAAFVFVVFPIVATIILLRLLAVSPWLVEMPHAQEVIFVGGIFSVVLGGVFASAQTAFGPLMGYATLFDLGNGLLALGVDTRLGVSVVLFSLLVRAAALVLVGSASAFIQQQAHSDSFAQARGLAYRWPIPVAGLMVGGAALAGAPLTGGFVSRWLLLQAVQNIDTRLPFIILLGSLGVTVGYIRALRALLQRERNARPVTEAQYWSLRFLMVLLMAGLTLGGIFPEPVLKTIGSVVQSLQLPFL